MTSRAESGLSLVALLYASLAEPASGSFAAAAAVEVESENVDFESAAAVRGAIGAVGALGVEAENEGDERLAQEFPLQHENWSLLRPR